MAQALNEPINSKPVRVQAKGAYSKIGLDLGSSQIKLVQLRKKRRRLFIHQYCIASLPEGAITGGRVVDPRVLAERLRWILKRRSFRKNRVNMCVGSQTVILRHVQLPRMAPREVPAAVRWEAEKQVMIPLDETVLDYIYLGDRVVEGKEVMEMLLVAVPKEVVNGYIEVAVRADLYPEVIEIEPFSLQRVIPFFNDGAAGRGPDSVMLLDLGGECSNLVVLDRDNFSFARTLNIGANHFCRRVSELRGTSFEAVQRLVYGTEPFAVEGVQEVADELVAQVRRSMEFFVHSVEYSKDIRSLYLCGGGVFIDRLASFLGFELKVEPKLLNPFTFVQSGRKFIRQDLENEGHLLNVGVGLALRGW